MINIDIFRNQTIQCINNLHNTYVNFYVDEKPNSKLSFGIYKQIHLDKLLNAKSISVEYTKEKIDLMLNLV